MGVKMAEEGQKTDWKLYFDRWFAIFFEVEGLEQMIVVNALDAEMAHTRFHAICPDQVNTRTEEVAFGVSSLLIEMQGRRRDGVESPFTRAEVQ
jgi:hypothetical protein